VTVRETRQGGTTAVLGEASRWCATTSPPGSETVACNLCRATGATPLVDGAFRMVRCDTCGLVYLNPRPTPNALLALYADYHTRFGQDETTWDRLMHRVFREVEDLLCASVRDPGQKRLLDVGCGFGGFVAAMRRRGWDVEGLDPSPTAVAAARAMARQVRLGTLGALQNARGKYDAITMFYVLEHLPDPLGALCTVWRLLGPGGILVLRVPHTTPIVRLLAPFGAGGSLYDPPFHLYDFSPAVLRVMLERAGFEDIRTFPGRPTVPARPGARAASAFFGALATTLHTLTRGAVLLPGVSKTTIARKPSD
jgi:SAM-dependent methyltransferase